MIVTVKVLRLVTIDYKVEFAYFTIELFARNDKTLIWQRNVLKKLYYSK